MEQPRLAARARRLGLNLCYHFQAVRHRVRIPVLSALHLQNGDGVGTYVTDWYRV